MRVYVITQNDPFYIPIFFKSLLGSLDDEVEMVRVFCLDPFSESRADLVGRMYRLYGLGNFLRRGIEFTARKVSDTIGIGTYSVGSVVQSRGVPVEAVDSINTESFVRRVHENDVAVILSVSAPEIFGPSLLNAPSWGCLNVHTSSLPKYRGMLPTFWALYHGDEEIGVTVHTMAEEIDQGQIAEQTAFPVADGDTLDDVIRRGKKEGGRLAAKVLNTLASGTISLCEMEGEGSYFSFPTAEHRRELQDRGRRLL